MLTNGREKIAIVRSSAISCAAAVMFAAGAAQAAPIQTITSDPDLNLSIPDGAYDGSDDPTATLVHTLDLHAPGDFIASDTPLLVTLWLDHDYAGDLTIKLISPAGTEIFLLNRPGSMAFGDGGDLGQVRGSNANLGSGFPITFRDDALIGATTMGDNLSNSDIIGDPLNGSSAEYRPSFNFYFAGLQSLSLLNGESAHGAWQLHIGDAATGQTGALQQWSIELATVVPEPTAAAMLAAGLLLIARRPRHAHHPRHPRPARD
ncbi:MAG: proprotein convertase P-domain-containing protein [Phycisphaeraceae bacterium]